MQRGDRVALRFEIVGEAARGGMGTVYRARDRRDERDVALKVVDGAGDVARFAREAALLATVKHPNIVAYVAHGEQYLVMEWVEGETLAARLARAGVDLREAVRIVRQVADALGALHAASIVHRDVKPSNVMLVGDHVKLVDLGVARRAGADARLTRTGAMIGTAGYMAPEQARGDRDVDERADIFSLGCVMYECLAGTAAFRGDSVLALRAKVLLHDPPRLKTIDPEIPSALDELVARMIAREIADRPGRATEVAAALDELGDLRASGPRIAVARDDVTRTSTPHPNPTCAVLVALNDTAELEVIAARAGVSASAVTAFDGGAVVACASLTEAARIALAIEDLGAAALACGGSPAEAVDRGGRLIEQLELASVVSGEPPTGAWVDAAAAQRLDPALLGERTGSRVRLRRTG